MIRCFVNSATTALAVFTLLALITYLYIMFILSQLQQLMTTKKSVHLQRVMKVINNTGFIAGFLPARHLLARIYYGWVLKSWGGAQVIKVASIFRYCLVYDFC